ncbi:DNA-binding protein [Aureimonas sp. AU22]|uniref:DNA-binding protein n=1 Tax=Aureimonas sp. AU22 TaxID=1638162 RepID=UPI000706A10E|nr:DNA-binding protein [Aureimonas sp. AU22]BAT30106.1 hypothetical protein [Aureimonas sp. AU22]
MMTLDDALKQATISVPDAGRLFFGMSRNAAYDAARSGDIPTIKVGSRVRAMVTPLAEKVGLQSRVGRAV